MKEKRTFLQGIYFGLYFLYPMWLIELMEFITGWNLNFLGIYPRHFEGLIGVLMAPLLHKDFFHLISNSFSLVILIPLVYIMAHSIRYTVLFGIWIVTGLWVWSFARENYHIGASGLVYGYASYLFFSGIFSKRVKNMAVSAIVMFMYGSLIYGIFPTDSRISWESHLLGGLSGIFFAYILRKRLLPKKVEYDWQREDYRDNELEYPTEEEQVRILKEHQKTQQEKLEEFKKQQEGKITFRYVLKKDNKKSPE